MSFDSYDGGLPGLSDEELLRVYGLAKRDHNYEGPIDDWPKRAERAATVAGLRAAIAADRAQRQPVPEPAGPTDEAWLEFIEQLRRVQDVAQCEGLGPRFDLVEFAMQAWRGRPEPTADGEVQELMEWLRELGARRGGVFDVSTFCANLARAAELLERLSPQQPVPVSERLPGPEEMTEDGEVWIEDPGRNYPLADAGDYDWDPHKWILRPIGKFDAKNGLRWLPAYVLPLPGELDHG